MENVTIPTKGRDKQEILDMMQDFRSTDVDFAGGKTWSLVYYLGQEHTDFLKKAYTAFFSENALNPMAFKSLKRFESEVIRMTANMLHGDRDVCGVMTSGGTESCMLSVKTYRDLARAKRPWIRKPEMVVPESIHVAFMKAAEYFDVKLVFVPLSSDCRVNVKALKKRINRNTVMIAASAPAYPHGVIDPIEEIGAIAKKKNIPFHVDGCVGTYLLPWVEKLGYDIPPFDFRVPGVTSMSGDIHKYGYTAKGASTLLYRNIELMKHQMFVVDTWPGGIFASPAMLGTRPGGAIAAAWANLMAIGEDGYMEAVRKTMDTTRALMDGIKAIDGLCIIGDPDASLFAVGSEDNNLNIYAVADQMEAKGWNIDRQQRPDGIHHMVTANHVSIIDSYLSDMRESVDFIRKHPEKATEGGAAMYGMISKVPFRGVIRKSVLKMMMDMYGPEGKIIDPSEEDDDLATKAGMAFLKLREKVVKKVDSFRK